MLGARKLRTRTMTQRRTYRRLDTPGAGVLGLSLLAVLAISTPRAQADKKQKPDTSPAYELSKSFKGKLPITQLSEDEAALHTLTRLGYGPRPGDIERVRKIGLKKWIDQQLHPDSIDDSALDERLSAYQTLKISSEKLVENFPPPDQAAKKEAVTKLR